LRTALWCRCREEDILYASLLKPDCLSLSVPVSDLHLERKMNKDRHWAEQVMVAALHQARSLGLNVAMGFEDATRADIAFLLHMIQKAAQAGAFRIRLADTVGVASPGQIIQLIREARKAAKNCEIAFHAHNDFGMATANAVAALEAGADWADVTVLGLGERSGCARLEEVAGYLSLVHNNQGFRPEAIRPLAELVAAITQTPIEDSRPIVGKKIFACETGLHLYGLRQDPATYEPYPPERTGAHREWILGAKSGRAALRHAVGEATTKEERTEKEKTRPEP
jgi:homocitrate synthase NifV